MKRMVLVDCVLSERFPDSPRDATKAKLVANVGGEFSFKIFMRDGA